MVAAFDIHYERTPAKGVAIIFDWTDAEPRDQVSLFFDQVAAYESGAFFKRELPCIVDLLEKLDLSFIDTLIVDGNVWVNNQHKKGLGAHVFDHLNGKIPVIGVAKNQLKECDQVCMPVVRGESQKPLWVSAIGLPISEAAEKIRTMQGKFRIPAILKKLDQLTRLS